MTAKEKLMREVLELDEARAARAQIVVVEEPETEAEVAAMRGAGDAPLSTEEILAFTRG